MSKYQEQHYKDVAAIIRSLVSVEEGPGVPYPRSQVSSLSLVVQFADLFAADGPPTCSLCGSHPGDDNSAGHNFEGGFDRERFLKACGLES